MKINLKNKKKRKKCKKSTNESGLCYSTVFTKFENGWICQKHKKQIERKKKMKIKIKLKKKMKLN
jgi:hypothetical protein